jgi:hypothetical protein
MAISAVRTVQAAGPRAGTLRQSSWSLGWRPLNLEPPPPAPHRG